MSDVDRHRTMYISATLRFLLQISIDMAADAPEWRNASVTQAEQRLAKAHDSAVNLGNRLSIDVKCNNVSAGLRQCTYNECGVWYVLVTGGAIDDRVAATAAGTSNFPRMQTGGKLLRWTRSADERIGFSSRGSNNTLGCSMRRRALSSTDWITSRLTQ